MLPFSSGALCLHSVCQLFRVKLTGGTLKEEVLVLSDSVLFGQANCSAGTFTLSTWLLYGIVISFICLPVCCLIGLDIFFVKLPTSVYYVISVS